MSMQRRRRIPPATAGFDPCATGRPARTTWCRQGSGCMDHRIGQWPRLACSRHPSCSDPQERRHARDLPLPATTGERPHGRQHLRPDRHRLHHGLRHHRHDQLRPRRGVHDQRLSVGHRPGPAGVLRPGILSAADLRHPAVHRLRHRSVRLGDRAHRLQAAAQLHPAGALDQRHRHLADPAELRADQPGRAPAGRADPARRRAEVPHR
ncbi:hypothetical protein D3C86_1310640 [compost metagenome]